MLKTHNHADNMVSGVAWFTIVEFMVFVAPWDLQSSGKVCNLGSHTHCVGYN